MDSERDFYFDYEVFTGKKIEHESHRRLSIAFDKVISRLNNGNVPMPHQLKTLTEMNKVRSELLKLPAEGINLTDQLCKIALEQSTEIGFKHTVNPYLIHVVAELNKLEGTKNNIYKRMNEKIRSDVLFGAEGYSGDNLSPLLKLYRFSINEETDFLESRKQAIAKDLISKSSGAELKHLVVRKDKNLELERLLILTMKLNNESKAEEKAHISEEDESLENHKDSFTSIPSSDEAGTGYPF